MKSIDLQLFFNDDLGLKSVSIGYNDTGLNDDSELLRKVAVVLLKSLHSNSDDVAVQDLLNELGIKKE